MVKVHVIYYSTYGHVKAMVDATVKGLKESGADVLLSRVPETVSEDVLKAMGAAGLKHNEEVPLVDFATWHEADAFVFAFPTRFGTMASQMKAFFDSTGGLWMKGALAGKPATFVICTGSQNSGQETTVLTSLPNLVHHGMIYYPSGYSYPKLQFAMDFAHGGSPWAPSTIAGGDGSRMPHEDELGHATVHGKNFGDFVNALTIGRGVLADKAQQ